MGFSEVLWTVCLVATNDICLSFLPSACDSLCLTWFYKKTDSHPPWVNSSKNLQTSKWGEVREHRKSHFIKLDIQQGIIPASITQCSWCPMCGLYTTSFPENYGLCSRLKGRTSGLPGMSEERDGCSLTHLPLLNGNFNLWTLFDGSPWQGAEARQNAIMNQLAGLWMQKGWNIVSHHQMYFSALL